MNDTKDVLLEVIRLLESKSPDCLGTVEDNPDRQGWYIRDEVVYHLTNVVLDLEEDTK